MEVVLVLAGAWQIASWLFALVDAIEAPTKKESLSHVGRRERGK